MAWVETRITRTTQPQDAVPIDWNNPITLGLREFVTGKGFASYYDSVVATDAGLSVNTNLTPVAYQSVASPSNEVTLFQSVVFSVIGSSSSFSVSSGGDSGFGFKNNTTSARLFKYRSAVANTITTSARTLTVGKRVAICGTFDGAVQRLYEDGVQSGSTANAEAVFWGASPKLRLGGFAINNFSGTASIFVYFARALSDAEIKSLSDNPWQIFEPEVTRIWVDSAASVSLPTLVQPSSTTSAGAWTATGAGSLHAAINELVPSDTQYISVNSASTTELVLAESAHPGTSSQTLAYRASSTQGSTLTVTLKQGATQIMTRTHALTGTDALYTQTLTSGEIALITSGAISVTLTTS